jgi:H+/Cl- antiporter ClcA
VSLFSNNNINNQPIRRNTCVQLFCLAAMSGGVPDVIAFLNGVVIRGTLNLTVLASKFFSAFCANAAGLPLGIEGPMITTGLALGLVTDTTGLA